MLKAKNLILILSISLLTITGCSKNDPPPTPSSTGVDVYAAGYTSDANYRFLATYWKNDNQIIVGSTDSYALSMGVLGTDIYLVGASMAKNGHYVATVWKNGVAKKLNDSVDSNYASGIAFTGSDVHIVGYSESSQYVPKKALYWKNGLSQTLSVVAETSVAYSIATTGTDVYITGYAASKNPVSRKAILWKNGIPTTLEQDMEAGDICINNGDIYVTGNPATASKTKSKTKYWKNGVAVALADSTSLAWTIAVNGSDVYLGGTSSSGEPNFWPLAIFWKNQAQIKLGDGKSPSNVWGITYYNGDLYVCGENLGEYAAYWKNGVATNLSKTGSRVYKMIIVPR